MIHADDTTQQGDEPAGDEQRDAPAGDRPDRRGPRGNQDVETVDVERGQGKIERVLGW
jgi:hypothetical protein